MTAFERLRIAVAALKGLPVLEWRDGYGDSGSLHVGELVAERSPRTRPGRGSYVVNVWEASVSFTSDRFAHEVHRHPPTELRDLGLRALAGLVVERASLEVDGSVTLDIGSRARVAITPSSSIADDEEQWALESEVYGTFVIRTGPTVIEETSDETQGGCA